MEVHIDVPWILQVAQLAGVGDPAPDDYGIPVAAVACHRAELLETPVYDGPYARAAALVHVLGRCRWLERSNLAVAAATGVMYLEASGITVKPGHDDAVALRDLLLSRDCTVDKIARLLRSWPTSS
ncbi:fic family toxin-antitoxin system, toxin component [Streptomyces longisporoflavus]|uniref:Fic family toxin-antitoxin system, toxin component n=1 Tax=Streptomyces longisporoflavus TaxID=28044 RepID=A0ABW7R2S8_9ACTN